MSDLHDDGALIEDREPQAGPPAKGSLYVSPLGGGIVVVLLGAVGLSLVALGAVALGILALPTSRAGPEGVQAWAPGAALVSLFLLGFGAFVLFPAIQYTRLIMRSAPFVIADETMISRVRLGFGETSIAWEHVGEIAIKGIWIILVDGRIKQSKFRRSMLGTRGLWIPAVLVHGGGTAVIKFIEGYRADLIGPLVMKVATGRAGRGQ